MAASLLRKAAVFVTLTPSALTVRNTGVTLEAPDKAFDAFHREETSGSWETGGSGLGLYMVKTILERHKMTYLIRNDDHAVLFEMRYLRDASYAAEPF